MAQKIFSILLFIAWTVVVLIGGYLYGVQTTYQTANDKLNKQMAEIEKQLEAPTPTPSTKTANQAPAKPTYYTGPQLWESVNKARIDYGVNPLNQKDILCTIAAIRLSQIRELEKLDGHDGFKGVFDKYKDNSEMPNNVSEFLISGYPTANQAVEGWLDTLGHKKLVTGGEYVYGCIYAQGGFGVAITGY